MSYALDGGGGMRSKAAIKQAAWREKNPDKYHDIQKRRRIKAHAKNFKLSFEELERLINQGCEVCGRRDGKICVDHDHVTGKFRGILCANCNLALGYVADSPGTLQKLITYLETH